MSMRPLRTGLSGLVLALIPLTTSGAHEIVGNRFFPATLTIDSVSRIPGTTQMLAGGFTHATDGTNVDAVLLQSS